MRFEVAFACLAVASHGQGQSWSDKPPTCRWIDESCSQYDEIGCCDGLVCTDTIYWGRCLPPKEPNPHDHSDCGAWGHFCEPGDGLCCDGLTCYTHPDPEIAAKGNYACTRLATEEIPQ